MKTYLKFNNITHQQIEYQIIDKMLEILENIPVLNNVDVFKSNQNDVDIEASAFFQSGEKLKIICEVKINGEPRYIRTAANQLLEQKDYSGYDYCIIAAPYISSASGKICEEMGIGYIDLSGNCLIQYKSLYIRIEGKPNKYKENRSSKSLFERSSIKSGIILRHALQKPDKQWKLQELAYVSSTSIGQVSKVKKFLEDKEFIENESSGFFIAKPKELISEWAKIYNTKSDTIYDCYSIEPIPKIEQRLIEMKETLGIEYALTGFSGAVRYAPTVRYNKVHVYIPLHDLDEAIRYLGFKKVESGANISIIVPYDPCVLMFARKKKEAIVASPVQLYLDLMGLKGRGEEAANAILDKEFN